jgi:hypothetical protein
MLALPLTSASVMCIFLLTSASVMRALLPTRDGAMSPLRASACVRTRQPRHTTWRSLSATQLGGGVARRVRTRVQAGDTVRAAGPLTYTVQVDDDNLAQGSQSNALVVPQMCP